MKDIVKRGAVYLAVMIILAGAASAINASLVDTNEAIQNLSYVDSASSYKDASPNSDSALLICGISSSKFAGISYAVNVSGNFNYTLINQRAGSTTYSLVNTSTSASSCSGFRTGVSQFIVSSSHISSTTPEAFVSAFPGRLWGLVSSNEDGSGAIFTFMNYSSGWLKGSFNSVSTSFDQITRNISIDIGSISFDGISGTKSPSDSTYGLSNDRRMVVGVCADDYGANCSDGRNINSSGDLPLELSSGLSAGQVNDQNSYTKYAVINGLGNSLCVGPDLQVDSISASDSTPYAGQAVNITAVISNNGNVNVTTDFNVTFNDSVMGEINVTLVTAELGNGSGNTQQIKFEYTPTGISGSRSVTAYIKDSDAGIADCTNTSSSDTKSTSINIQKTYNVDILIDNTDTVNFSEAGHPYNVSISVNDSDGTDTENATIKIYEVNGINIFAPVQNWSKDGYDSGLSSISTAQVETNSTGDVIFALIPTGNKLYESAASPYAFIGNYSIYMEIFNSSGSKFKLSYKGSLMDNISFNLLNHSTSWQTGNQTNIINQNNWVSQVLDYAYQIYANGRHWILGS